MTIPYAARMPIATTIKAVKERMKAPNKPLKFGPPSWQFPAAASHPQSNRVDACNR
jgi:hypothetical protein